MGLRRTPLRDLHVAAGAKVVEFGGWEMPLQYQGIVAEHRACRAGAGLFDVSHMGEVALRGPRAAEAVQLLVTNAVGKLDDGAAMYTVMCYPDGGIVDDCIVYRRAADDFMVVCARTSRAMAASSCKGSVDTCFMVVYPRHQQAVYKPDRP